MDSNSMKNFIISIFFLTSFYSYSQECSSFYLIRHAEKLRIDKSERNPKLNEKGILRAEKWKEVLKNINLDKTPKDKGQIPFYVLEWVLN